jgi:hypothetical protein
MPTLHSSRKRINSRANRGWASRIPHPRVYDLVISRMNSFGNSQRSIPARVLLNRYRPGDPSSEQLFLDQMPVPRNAWDYDVADRILTWRGAYGGGRLYMSHNGLGATGIIGSGSPVDLCSVKGGASAIFDCAVAVDVGAGYETSGGEITGLKWDPTSSDWKNAAWVQDRLRLKYTVTTQTGGPPLFTFDFQDNETPVINPPSWDPQEGDFEASLQPTTQNGQNVWSLVFRSSDPPPQDAGSPGSAPATGPDSVYPYWLQAIEDIAAATINGVLQIDGPVGEPNSQLIGMQGICAQAAASGYYRTSAEAVPFGVFNGRMTIGGQPIPHSQLRGSELHWRDLAPEFQKSTGLPETGSLRLLSDGSAVCSQTGVRASRLTAADALAAIVRHNEMYPELDVRVASMQEALNSPSLDIYGLLAMNPYVQNAQGAWGDAVQAAVRQDLSDIMNSFIPSDMWSLLFPGIAEPTLSGELATVANSPVTGVSDPKDFYKNLAAAVMTQGMAAGSDPNSRLLNAPRAAAWLQTQLATSAVYNTHGQLLFNYEWQQRFNLTSSYTNDQIQNASTYEALIDSYVQSAIDDINTNVTNDPSNPNLKSDLITLVQNAGQYAKDQKLYWAYYYYFYNTHASILANIQLAMSLDGGSSDGTYLTRMLQQNVAVLTALDPSGYFARQYTQTINTFLVTNVLPSMFDFNGDSSSFDVMKAYLQAFVTNNLNSEDAAIANAAKEIQGILSDEQADQILEDSLAALRSIAAAIPETLALPYVANGFLKWTQSYPKLRAVGEVFGSLLIGGLTALGIFNLFSAFKDWKELSDAQKAQVIIQASQLGLEIVAAVVKRGVRIYAIFQAEGLTGAQRASAIFKVLGTGGGEVEEGSALYEGLVKIGNSTARWLGDTEGTAEFGMVESRGAFGRYIYTSVREEGGWAGKIFGRNLDEFIATRIGPILILAGIGLSIYFIAKGEPGAAALANDCLNIIGGSFALFATVGGWLVDAGVVAAEGVLAAIFSFAGVLGVLCALAGIGLMIYELFQKPPDPVQEFVDDYAGPAGFTVSGQSSSIDYAVPYINPDQGGLLMVGFSLSANQQYLLANNAASPPPSGVRQPIPGSIRLGNATALPDCVWLSQTDGLGLSQIGTVVELYSPKPVPLLLSLMSDNTVSFQPAVTFVRHPVERRPIVTQTWLITPVGNATLTSDGHLASIPLTFRAVPPDSNGNYSPSNASRWLKVTESGITSDATASTVFTLQMSGMAPNYMHMVDINFLLNSTPTQQQTYGPAFAVPPSTPLTFSQTGQLPPFLTFSAQTGAFTPDGTTPASSTFDSNCTVAATNALNPHSPASASFTITVKAAPPLPTAATKEAMSVAA